MRRLGIIVLSLIASSALLAPWLATGDVSTQHEHYPYAAPMLPSVRTPDGAWHLPFVTRRTLQERLPPTYADTGEPLPLQWFTGSLVRSGLPEEPLLPLGSDALGRDVWSRLLFGARRSLGLAGLAVAGAVLVGTAVGLLAGYAGGRVDLILMRVSDLIVALPALYVVLVMRASMPLVLSSGDLFALMALVLTLAGWPAVARGVRAIVITERVRAYIHAAEAAGASPMWVMRRHLLPAVRPYLLTQAVLLLPAFILAEATLSFVSLGFAEPSPSWGTMLRDATSGYTLREAPWLLAPAVAIAVVTCAANLTSERR